MKMPPGEQLDTAELRDKIIGLGEKSFRKSYYPELQKKLEDLERYKTLLDQSNDAIFLVKVPSGHFLSVSESAYRQIGYTEGDCRAKTIYDLLPGSRGELDRILSGKTESLIFDAMLQKCGGEKTPYEMNMHKVKFGGSDYVVVVARDVTERKRAEKALKESEESLRLALDGARMGMWNWNLVTGELAWSDRCKEIFGIPKSKAMSYEVFMHAVYQEDREGIDRAVNNALEQKTDYDREMRSLWPDGSLHWVASKGRGFYDEEGRAVRMLGIALDVTERKIAEEELRESEEKFRALAESSTAAIFILQGDKLVSANEAMEKIIGYSREELLRQQFTDFIHPDFREMVLKRATGRQRGEPQPPQYEFKIVTRSGREKWILLTAGRIMYKGKPGVVGTIFDITERKQAEEALQESEEKFRALAESSPAAIFVLQGDRYLSVNKAAAVMTGYSADELLKLKITEIIHPDFREMVLERALRRQRGEPQPPQYETRIVTKNGDHKWVLLSASRILYQGKPAGVATMFDITERKQIEEERELLLHEIDGQRRRLQTILESLPVGLFIVDTRRQIVLANHIARNYRGGTFPPTIDELAKNKILWADTGKPFSMEESGLVKALSKGETTTNEIVEIEDAKGNPVTLICSAAPLLDASGNITGAMLITLDITEMRKLEEELGQSRRQAELYLDLMSHDITNMNQALMGCLEMMELTMEAGQFDKSLIDSSIEIIRRSSRMIDEVKKLTMVQAGKVPRKAVNVCEVLSAVKARYSTVQGRTVMINYAPGPACMVMADDMLREGLDSLVENAIRHSSGPVTIDLAVEKVTREGREWYEITVADTGPGIPDSLKKKIFMPLKVPGEKAVRRGFGLYLVRTLVDHYQGRVWVEDRVPGDYTQGSKFIVQLPSPQTRDSQA